MSSILLKAKTDKPEALLIMFHGVGASPEPLQPLGEFLQKYIPGLEIYIPAGFYPSTISPSGFQWFDVIGVTEANRPDRVNQVMPVFDSLIQAQAEQAGVSLDKVVLLGFSQGTIMSLEWLKQSTGAVAGIIGISGRFAELPAQKPATDTPVCLIHGEADPVINVEQSKQSHQQLTGLGQISELHLIPNTPHTITQEMCPIINSFIQKVI